MTANVHLLVAHGVLYLKWAQDEVGVPLGILTEGSIEKCNQDVKHANSSFVARISVENIHRNILVRRSWEADPVLHYEGTVLQVILSTAYLIFVTCTTCSAGVKISRLVSKIPQIMVILLPW